MLCYKWSFHLTPKPTVCPHAVSPQYGGSMLFFYSCELGFSVMTKQFSFCFTIPVGSSPEIMIFCPHVPAIAILELFLFCGFVTLVFYGYVLKGIVLLCVYIYFCTCFLHCLHKIFCCSSTDFHFTQQRIFICKRAKGNPLVAW